MNRLCIKKIIYLIVFCFFLSSCATGYHKLGLSGGYDETQLQKDIFRVYYKGNIFSSKEKIQDYLLLRCAELTIDHGYDYFAILDEENYIEQSTFTTPTQISSQSTTQGDINYSGHMIGNTLYGSGNYSGQTQGKATITGGQTCYFYEPRSNCIIRCFKGKNHENFPGTFVAYELIDYLKNKVR